MLILKTRVPPSVAGRTTEVALMPSRTILRSRFFFSARGSAWMDGANDGLTGEFLLRTVCNLL